MNEPPSPSIQRPRPPRAMVLHGSRGDYPFDEGKHVIAVGVDWWAYGDDTGTHAGSKYAGVVGYVASPRQWKKFRADWRTALQADHVKPEFWSEDFFQINNWQSQNSPYHGWNLAHAKVFLEKLLTAIHRYDLRPIGWFVDVEDFLKLSVNDRRLLTGATNNTRTRVYQGQVEITDKLLSTGAPMEPYFASFHPFITDALRTAPMDVKVNFVLDRRSASEARARDAFREIKLYSQIPEVRDRIGLHGFDDSWKCEELQAADLYAYISYRYLNKSFNSLVEQAIRKLYRKRTGIPLASTEDYQELLDVSVSSR